MRKGFFKGFAWLALLLAGGLLAACGGNGGGSDTGTLQVGLTDAANPEFSQVVISVKEIRVVPPGDSADSQTGQLPAVVTFSTPQSFNVLDLKFQQQILGEAQVPAGDYNQLRLVLSENADPANPVNYVVLASNPGVKIPLTTPSGQESGLKIVGHFSVNPGQATAVVLDFDPGKAIVQSGSSGNWSFKPTGIRVVQVQDSLADYGAISGQVVQMTQDATTGQDVQTPVTNALVLVTDADSGVLAASTSVNSEDGTFRVFLPAGSYNLQVNADGFDPFTSAGPYDVVVGQEADAGTIVLTPASPAPAAPQ
ncbi:MAG: DUF4382 domain-containing protein [Desulfuromonadales bacterium]